MLLRFSRNRNNRKDRADTGRPKNIFVHYQFGACTDFKSMNKSKRIFVGAVCR